jgi:tetratricopeptide (TPR) repeat protein
MLADRYELLEELGSGGMSIVYKAMDTQMNRVVAIKMLKAATQVGGDKSALRLQQEAKALSVLKHENILEIYSMGVTPEGTPFLVTELILGKTLSDLIGASKVELPTAVNLFVQICNGLIDAHAKGIVHRDLKPSNVMVIDDPSRPRVKIMDFGVSKILNLEPNALRLTQTGVLIGSPLYMSPEQVTGKTVDARSDIYAMGCLMFEVLTGKPPFEAETLMESMHKKLSESFSQLAPQLAVPRDLQIVIEKCLQTDPNKRFQSAAELANAISAVKASGPIVRSGRPLSPKVLKTAYLIAFIAIGAATAIFAGVKHMEATKQTENKELAELSLKQAESAMHAKKFDDAIRLLDKSIALDPTNSFYYLARGVTRLSMNQDEEHRLLAEADFDRAIETEPRNAEALRQKSVSLARRGKLEAALNMVNGAIRVSDYLDARLVRAEFLNDLQLNHEALKELNYIIAHENNLDRRYNLMKAIVTRARVYIDLDRFPEARADLERTANYRAHVPTRFYHLSFLHIKEKRYDEALKVIDHLAAIEPHYAKGLLSHSRALSFAGKAEAERDPTKKKVYAEKARLYFDDAARAVPLEPALRKQRAAFYLAQGRADELKLEIAKLENEAKSGSEQNYLQAAIRAQALGEAYIAQKKYVAAAPFFHDALKLCKAEKLPDEPPGNSTRLMRANAYLGIAICDFHKEKIDDAIKMYGKALEPYEMYFSKNSPENLIVLEPYKDALEAAQDPRAKEISAKITTVKLPEKISRE